jgi:S-DNA-T family DNA segregation ATPase FtsK/SpoIIIE
MSRILAFFLVIIGVLLLVSTALAVRSIDLSAIGLSGPLFDTFLLPGSFLYASFSFAAFLVPPYLIVSAWFLLRGFRSTTVYDLNAFAVPFLTFALILRLAFSPDDAPATGVVISLFGRAGGVIVLSLLFVLEVLLFFQYRRRWKARFEGRPDREPGRTDSAARAAVRHRLSLPPYEEPAGTASESGRVRSGSQIESPVVTEPVTESGPSRSFLERAERILSDPAAGVSGSGLFGRREVTEDSRHRDLVPEQGTDADDGKIENGFTFRVPKLPELPSLRSIDPKPVDEKPVPPAGEDIGRDGLPDRSLRFDPGHDTMEDDRFEDDAIDGGTDPYDDPETDEDPDESDDSGEEYELDPELDEDGESSGPGDELATPENEPEIEDDTAKEPETVPAAPQVSPAARIAETVPGDVRQGAARNAAAPRTVRPARPYAVPVDGLLHRYKDGGYSVIDDMTKRAASVLRETLEEFNIKADVTGIRKGPVITMFELLPAPGVKLSKIVNLADNIALRLAASSVRIVAPIPGKHAVGIEVPNPQRGIVSFSEMLSDDSFFSGKAEIPIALGKDIAGGVQIMDLVQTPHLLIAGATGSGKSVCVNSIICSILYRRSPDEVKLMLIDPKIVELKFYNDIPHLLTPVITEPKRAFQALQWCIYEMERRYTLLDALGVRDIRSYNRKIRDRNLATQKLPYIVVIIDEFADLMATTGKELESTLARLAAMSRAVGIHLVLATQRPSIDVITGLIKANIPSRIAFMVASKFDSRIIIDAVGAEKLLGKGDMLFASAWDPFPVRLQGAYLSEDEVERVVAHVKELGEPEYIDDEIFFDDEEEEDLFEDGDEDPLLDQAIEIVVSAGKASASYLQRRLKVGYNRAARMVELLERRGIVGPQNGSKPRELIRIPEEYQGRGE